MAGSKKDRKQYKGRLWGECTRRKNVVHITPDALFSIYDAKTGESANVYRVDDYSEDNPVYLVKGTDINGNEYEQTAISLAWLL